MPCMQTNFQRKGQGWQWFETHFAICRPWKIHGITKGERNKGKKKSVFLQCCIALKYWYCYLHALISLNSSFPASVRFRGGFVRVEADWEWESETKMTKGRLSTHGCECNCKTVRRSGCEIQREESKWHETDSRWLKGALRMYGDANRPDTTREMTANPSDTSSSLHLYDIYNYHSLHLQELIGSR